MPEIDELLQAGDPLRGGDPRAWHDEALQVAREVPVAAGRPRGRWVPLAAAAAAVTLVVGALAWQHQSQRIVPAAPVGICAAACRKRLERARRQVAHQLAVPAPLSAAR